MKYLSIQTFQCGISVSGAATFTGGATINLLALNGATTSSEASLFLGAHGTLEGGQLVLQKGSSQTYAAHLDNYSDQFRVMYGTNTGSTGVSLGVNLATGQLNLPFYTTTTSFSGTVVGYLAFDSTGKVITTPIPAGGVTSIIAGTGVTVSSGTGNVTVSIGQSVATSATPSFDQVYLTNNGNGTNVKIGDDAWIGDINTSNTFRVMGQQNNANGYIVFGNANTDALGRSGTGNLTYAGSTVWTASTLTDLNQLTNGPGYITAAALAGYVPTSRILTINGTSYDLSADRTWTISTVDYTSRLQHQVKAGVAINKGQAVYVTSADGTNMIVGLASNASEATSSKTMGLLDATVSTNGFANVVTEGLLAGLDTSTAGAEGDPVWLGTGGNLIYGLINKPYAPAHLVFIGIVTRKNSNNGEIFVKVQNGFELNEIHDVDLKTNLPVNGELLGFNGTLWINKTIAGWLGYTPANASGTTNYLSKFTGSTTLGNSQIFDNGTNVGIGTASPSVTLEANGKVRSTRSGVASQYLEIDGGTAGAVYLTAAGASKPLVIQNNNTTQSDIWFDQAVASPYLWLQAGAERMRITSGGSLLIGSTTQAYNPQTQGYLFGVKSNTTQTFISIAKSGQTLDSGGMIVGLDTTTGYVWMRESTDLTFGTNNSTRVTIAAAGNVGIGATSPASKLEVRGTVTFFGDSSFQAGNLALVDVTSGGSSWSIYSGFPSLGDFTIRESGVANHLTIKKTSGNVGIGTTTPAVTLQVDASGGGLIRATRTSAGSGYIQMEADGTNGTLTANNILYLNAGGSTKLTVLSGGNVGIGTTSPSGKLTISQNNSGGVAALTFTEDESTIQGPSANTKILMGGNLSLNAASTWIAGTNGSERMRIDSSGNLGLGVTPSAWNTVTPVFQIGYTAFSAYQNTQAIYSSNAVYTSGWKYLSNTNATYYSQNEVAPGVHAWKIAPSGTAGNAISFTQAMTLNASGNLSIGNTNDTYKLDVTGTARFTGQVDSETKFYVVATPPATNGGLITVRDTVTATNVTSFAGVFFNSSPGSDYSIGKLTENGTGYLQIRNANSGAELLRMTASGVTTFSSSVTASNLYTGADNFTAQNGGWFFNGVGSYTSGIFASSSSNNLTIRTPQIMAFESGGAERMRLDPNGNLGIGTSSPAYKLDVATGNDNAIRILNSTGSNNNGLALSVGSGTPWLDFYGGRFDIKYNTLPGSWNSGANTFLSILSSGNVGIGTTAPGAKLTIGDDNSNIAELRVLRSNALSSTYAYVKTNGGTSEFGGTGDARLRADGSSILSFYTNSSERMRIAANGNVGIGTVSPSGKLDIAHDMYTGAGNGVLQAGAYGSINFKGASSQGTTTTQQGITWQVDSYGGSTNYGVQAQIAVGNNGNVGTFMGLFTSENYSIPPIERIRIQHNGNIGINTTSPSARLHISGSTDATQRIIVDGSGNNSSLHLNYNGSNVGFINSYQNSELNIGTSISAFVNFYTNNTERMRITAAGNVGIGTSSPSFLLTVSGKIYSSTEIQANTAVMNTTGGYASFGSNSGSIPVRVSRDASLSDIIIDTTGYVGIGTSTPSDKLHVSGSLRVTGTIIDSNNSPGTSGQVLSSTATGTDWVSLSEITGVDGTGTANYVTKWSDADTIANSLIYDNGTNVGIGTTSPGYNLDVNGQVRVQDKLRVGTGNGVVHMSSTATINASATTVVWAQTVSVGMCAFIEYYILNNNSLTDQRAGTIMVTWNQSGTPTIAHTETTTPDIGSTIAVNFTSSLVGSDARINAVNSSANPYTMVMSYKYF